MPLTPVEVRHVDLNRAWLRGYRRKPVDQLLDEIADSFEEVWRERADLSDRLEELEAEASKHRELEALLRSTLVSAERAAQDMKEHARREADVIVQEAGAEGRRLIRDAIAEKEQLLAETRRVRSIMRAALDVLAEGQELQGENDRDEPAERAEAATPQLTEPPAASTEVDRLAG